MIQELIYNKIELKSVFIPIFAKTVLKMWYNNERLYCVDGKSAMAKANSMGSDRKMPVDSNTLGNAPYRREPEHGFSKPNTETEGIET